MIRRILNLTEPAEVTRLTTLETLKAELNDTGTENDVKYGNAIDYCSNEISAYLSPDADDLGDVTIGRATFSEVIYGACGVVDLVLGRMPIGDVISVAENGAEVLRVIDDEVNPAFPYVIKKSSATIWKMQGNTPTPFYSDIVTVAYTAGWILPGQDGRTLPMAIEDACLLFCRTKLDQKQGGDDLAGPLTGVSVEGVGNFQFAKSTTLKGNGVPYEVRNLIDRYKIPTFA